MLTLKNYITLCSVYKNSVCCLYLVFIGNFNVYFIKVYLILQGFLKYIMARHFNLNEPPFGSTTPENRDLLDMKIQIRKQVIQMFLDDVTSPLSIHHFCATGF